MRHSDRLIIIIIIIIRISFITSAEEGGYVFASVCLSVRRITEKVVNGFRRNFLEG